VHEGQHLEPAARDIEALLASSQARVTGEVHLLFRPGALFVEGVTSPHSLLAATKGKYGESAGRMERSRRARPGAHEGAGRHAAHAGGRMSGCGRLIVDKIASVAQSCRLGRELRIATEIPCEEGVVIAVEVLSDKSTYNTLELTSGAWRRSSAATSWSARSATATRCSATRATSPRSSRRATRSTC
jgi:hypothetical protein